MIVFFEDEFLPKEDVCVSPDDRGFLFADGVYEVLCAYEGRLFKAEEHWDRLERSLREIRMAGPAREDLEETALELLRRNDLEGEHAKVYFQLTRGVAPRQHAFPEVEAAPTLYGTVVPYTPPEDQWARGVKVILQPDERWLRCDIKSVALLPNVLVSQRAKEEDAYEAVLVRDEIITEGSHTNVMAVFDGEVRTHPLDSHVLPGITRRVVLDLCRQRDIPVRETPIRSSELQEADELIVLGTTTGVMPVVQVDDLTVADGEPGPVTRQLQQAFREEAGI